MIQWFRGPYDDGELFTEDPTASLLRAGGNGRLVMVAVPLDAEPPPLFRRGAPGWMQVIHPRAVEPFNRDAGSVLLEPVRESAAARVLRDLPVGDAARLPTPAFRKLFPDPGLRRIVLWGDFRETLTPHLAEPERLQDSHRLLCFVQVYEATAPQPLEALAAAVQVEAGAASRLEVLSPEQAARLQLSGLLRGRPRVAGRGDGGTEELAAGELVFRLQVAIDPTLTAEARRAPRRSRGAAAAPQAPVARPPRPRAAIPDPLVRPWEFRLSREEALYDMSAAAAKGSWLGALLRGWRVRLGLRRAWRKWQALLWGKSLDEQLWAVRPPQGRLSHPGVREWARTTLERAGYDPFAMLPEWEIFWRRKGA